MPQCVRCDPKVSADDGGDRTLGDVEGLGDAPLPDGLHIDINDGRPFRHRAAILYLADDAAAPRGGGAARRGEPPGDRAVGRAVSSGA